jgi:hypothetical protein
MYVYMYIYYSHCISVTPNLFESYLMRSYLYCCDVVSFLLYFEALLCRVLCSVFIPLFPVTLLWACTHVLSQ